MTADDARKITKEHSKKVKALYASIETSAKRGNSEVVVSSAQCGDDEIQTLKKNGFSAGYEYSETDGGQFVLIKW